MNIYELKKELDKEKIPEQWYSIKQPCLERRFIIEEIYGKWYVYYLEKGEHLKEQDFDNEEDACGYLYEELLKERDF